MKKENILLVTVDISRKASDVTNRNDWNIVILGPRMLGCAPVTETIMNNIIQTGNPNVAFDDSDIIIPDPGWEGSEESKTFFAVAALCKNEELLELIDVCSNARDNNEKLYIKLDTNGIIPFS